MLSKRLGQWELVLGQLSEKYYYLRQCQRLVSGITVTRIALVGSTAIAGVIGAGGLGNLAYLTGFTRNQNDVILVSTVFILIIVFIIQFIGDWITNKIDKR